jgi:ribosomal protein L11 methyltransferase
MDSIALHIDITPAHPWSEIAVTWLAEEGCNAFEENATGIVAYAAATDIIQDELIAKIESWAKTNSIEVKVKSELIPHQNWNAKWESDFHPVEVDDLLTIIAPFHEKTNRKGMVVEIQPQMSFGTGHHQTTWMMSKALFEFGVFPNSVLDMGTGTGILAIVAEKLGAKNILAIDIEAWSAENTRENAIRNQCLCIETLHGDVDLLKNREFGLILANINKNVLKAQFEQYNKSLATGGRIVMSGFFDTDVTDLLSHVEKFGFELEKKWNKETWAAIQLKRK